MSIDSACPLPARRPRLIGVIGSVSSSVGSVSDTISTPIRESAISDATRSSKSRPNRSNFLTMTPRYKARRIRQDA
jgi:hypothetical protein